VISIYKKLPKTNCGNCGFPTCMAFAMKVKKAEAMLSDCPFVTGDMPEELRQESGKKACSTYEFVSKELEKEAVAVDFKEAAQAVGGTYESAGGEETVRIVMMNKVYELRKQGLFQNGLPCGDPWEKIVISDYVRRRGSKPLTGEWIALGQFAHTASHVKVFQSSAEKKIAALYGDDPEGLRRRCAEMGGDEAQSTLKADYCCRFLLLPHVPLYLACWAADEDFGAECKLFFDRSAEDHIDIEYLAHLMERFIGEF